MFMTGANTIPRLNSYLDERPDLSFINTDISGWDSLRCRFLLKDIFSKVLRPHMLFTEAWHERAYDYLVESFIFTHLALPSGHILKKLGGVPSGSFLTLLINSLGVWQVMTSCLQYNKQEYTDSRVLGDDFCFKLPPIDDDMLPAVVSLLSSTVADFFGLVIKPEKVISTNNREDRKFIGYQIKQGKIWREDRDIFCGMLYPESPVKNLSISFSRIFAFMIIGGFSSGRVTRFYESYLSGYHDKLRALGDDLFNTAVMRSGNLRVFKHVFKVDVDLLEDFDIDTFRSLFSAKAPYFLSLGAKFLVNK